jgi:DNA-binding NtrC family response regulator
MGYVLEVLERLQDRPYRTNALILGEPGTGKGGLARSLAQLVAPHGKTVRMDLGGFNDEDALDRLCGTTKTAGLAENAHEGTLIIEETADLSLRVQNEFLRILKTGKVRRRGSGKEAEVRLCAMALSDRDLRGMVSAGQFRHDLFYRLARVVLWLPPLRERLDDVGAAAVWMGNRILQTAGVPLTLRGPEDMKRATEEEQRRSIELAPAAIEALQNHTWPGNFRELEAALERALLLFRTDRRLGADEVVLALRESRN